MLSSERREALGADPEAIVDQLAGPGFARVPLSVADRRAMTRLYGEMARFFAADESVKRSHATPGYHFGYRSFGRQYSVDPGRPDLNDSFAYWCDDPSLIPGHERLEPFTQALHEYWQVAARVSRAIIDEIAARFSYGERFEFERTSYIEANSYVAGATRDLLQDRHEDGHLLTLAATDGRGLEIEVDGVMQPFDFAGGELIVMPGSLMAAMTGGWIAPLYHQVRNYRLPSRSSILYLANPPFGVPVAPFTVNENNRDLDIELLTKTNGQHFGLPEAPDLER